MIALLLGTILTLAALAFVLYPLFAEPQRPARTVQPAPRNDSRSRQLIVALREVEFDRATGKLSAEDYGELKAAYTREAVAAMRAEEGAESAVADSHHATHTLSDDELETVIRRYRSGTPAAAPSCATCGPRPEPDAVYCSSCGGFLPATCPTCAAKITEPGSRFCSVCGAQLGAGVLQSA